MTIRTITIKPQINAMTFKGLVIVIVSIVVVGAMAEGDGCRLLIREKPKGIKISFHLQLITQL